MILSKKDQAHLIVGDIDSEGFTSDSSLGPPSGERDAGEADKALALVIKEGDDVEEYLA